MDSNTKLSILCLGTGKGASMVYDGNCSPGYVLYADDRPIILFGAGYGVTRQCLRYCGVIPSNIFLFSNRSHMSAELPVIIAVESRKARRLRIITGEKVMTQIKLHRLSEVHSRIDINGDGGSIFCDFVALPDLTVHAAVEATVTQSLSYHLPDTTAGVSLVVFHTPATDASNGVILLHHGVPVLALTGDCAYSAEKHQEILRMAPVVILDGRQKSSRDHASFADIIDTVERCEVAPQRVFIGQYGLPLEAPPVVRGGAVAPIVEGAVVSLGEHPSLKDVNDLRLFLPSSTCSYSQNVTTDVTFDYQPKKIFIIDNDSPDIPPSLLMVHQYRNIAQVKKRISEMLHIRPVGGLFCFDTGQRLRSVAQLTHGMRVVATRVGGRPFVRKISKMYKPPCGTIVESKTLNETNLSIALDSYMHRAYQILGETLGSVGFTTNTSVKKTQNSLTDNLKTNTGADVEVVMNIPNNESHIVMDSSSLITAELSPETSSLEPPDETQYEISSTSGVLSTGTSGYSLKFTTLRS
ncbi:putative periplasmic protein [Trypanosoma theileri]|uniref:Putative periplasmic protein n=1 Tax=Trypanosoma theileri TaxID=67003 RepID=A0A1X0NPV1_9TRYP|nr:putative periplasmic protein [Trypanosoma theileri]ORC86209.1 putative periplasmic protein [Trypanosoma theileri]